MPYRHLLTRHHDIQSWVADQQGTPAISRIRTITGEEKAQLRIRFAKAEEGTFDTGMSPCSWSAWLAELDRQQLALSTEPDGRFELVSRTTMN